MDTFWRSTSIFDLKNIYCYNEKYTNLIKGRIMGKRDEKIEQYIAESKKLGLTLSNDLIEKVTVGLGPSIYKKDSETIACSQVSELDTVKKNFLKKKLGLTDDDSTLDAAIKKICETMGSSNRNKYRALFYALLTKEFKKESIYA